MVTAKVTSLSDPKVWQAAYAKARKGAAEDIAKFMEIIDPAIKQEAGIYANNSHDFNDFCQHAREYILQVLQTKKETIKKAQNYFMKTIRCDMVQSACNTTKNKSRLVNGMQDELLDDTCFEQSLKKGVARYCNDNISAYCDLREVLSVIKLLPKKVQRIIMAPVTDGKKSCELATELNMTTDNVDKIRERTRKMLKQIFSEPSKKAWMQK